MKNPLQVIKDANEVKAIHSRKRFVTVKEENLGLIERDDKPKKELKYLMNDLMKSEMIIPTRKLKAKEKIEFQIQGNLKKFNWLNGKKIEVSRFFQMSSDKIDLYTSLYSHGLRVNKPTEEINFKTVSKIKGLKEFTALKFVWRLFLFVKCDKEESNFENYLMNLKKEWIKVIEIIFEKEDHKEAFLNAYFSSK